MTKKSEKKTSGLKKEKQKIPTENLAKVSGGHHERPIQLPRPPRPHIPREE
ncbi:MULTISPECIES: hypothetical protein [Legionella]|uniref:Uncharacterized protein n=1 Tax=Legionella donaldsonii TaxID=45060 RepID=A0A378JET4_9GAMM|nr:MULTISPECIES: hypothetical protein [Legionella]MCC5016191.1 hypothetical protein [Legionella sp. 31fI33]STX43150.1 Uncharacterised protein [Legionella donaldsonii]